MKRSELLCKLAKNNKKIEVSEVSHRIDVENEVTVLTSSNRILRLGLVHHQPQEIRFQL